MIHTSVTERIHAADEMLLQGQVMEAENIYTALLKELSPESNETGLVLLGLGIVNYRFAKLVQAQEKLEAALGILQKLHDANTVPVAHCSVYLSAILGRQGAIDKARDLGYRALGILEEKLSEDADIIAEANFLLSQLEYHDRNFGKAKTLILRSLSIWEKQVGTTKNLAMSTCFNNLGRIYEELGMLKQGIDYHQKCLAIRREILDTHRETAFSLGNLGTALAQNNEWSKATDALSECVQMYEHLQDTSGIVEGYRKNLLICRQAMDASE